MEKFFLAVVGRDEDGPPLGEREPADGLLHMVALACTKIADGLIDPKLVLAWLLNALGAPGAFIGALAPVREAGALLPQIALARWVERSRLRKPFWSAGSAAQGLAAFAIAVAAVTLEGWAAGAAVVGFVAVLAVARSLCSISQKDVLARTVGKTRRGAVTGAPASAASAVVLAFGAALAFGIIPLAPGVIALAIAAAGVLWLAAAGVFMAIGEPAERPEDDRADAVEALAAPFRDDPQFRRFVLARALLTATALAPPFLVILAAAGDAGGLGRLGPLMLASAAASIVSAYVWGRLSDRSSRRTLMAAAGLGAAALAGASAMGFATGGIGGAAGSVLAVFSAQIAYEGVRAGRKLHLTDMAEDSERPRYTALSNSLIGVVLIFGGALGFVADMAGPAWALAALAALCLAALPVAASLEEVQADAA